MTLGNNIPQAENALMQEFRDVINAHYEKEQELQEEFLANIYGGEEYPLDEE